MEILKKRVIMNMRPKIVRLFTRFISPNQQKFRFKFMELDNIFENFEN